MLKKIASGYAQEMDFINQQLASPMGKVERPVDNSPTPAQIYREKTSRISAPSANTSIDNPYVYAETFANNAKTQADNSTWGAVSKKAPEGVPSKYNEKWKCNILPAWSAHAINAENNPFVNHIRKDYHSAKGLRQLIEHPETAADNGFKGNIMEVDRDWAAEHPGVIVSEKWSYNPPKAVKNYNPQSSVHTGISVGDGKSISASEDRARVNDFGFRNKHMPYYSSDVKYAYMFPENVSQEQISKLRMDYLKHMFTKNLLPNSKSVKKILDGVDLSDLKNIAK